MECYQKCDTEVTFVNNALASNENVLPTKYRQHIAPIKKDQNI